MSPFEPLGPKARWRIIYDLLKETPTDAVLTYAAMGKALSIDAVKQRHEIQVAVRRAAQEHLLVDNRAITAVVNEGYRVVEPREHYSLARVHQKRSTKSLVRGHSVISHIDWSSLTPGEHQIAEVVGALFAAQLDFNRRTDIRQHKLEAALEVVREDQEKTKDRTDGELAELKARLARLESTLRQSD